MQKGSCSGRASSFTPIMQVNEDHASECICFVEGLSYK